MRASEDEQKVIGFLQTYPDYSPSPEQVARMTAAVKRNSMQDEPSTLSWTDGIFAALFVPLFIVLLSAAGFIHDTGGWLAGLIPGCSFSHLQALVMFCIVAIPPLLLVIVPLNDRR